MEPTDSDTDSLDYSSDEGAELGYEPEDTLLYAIELGMAIEPPELTEEDLTWTYADTYHQLMTVKSTLPRIAKNFIYNDWASTPPIMSVDSIIDDDYFRVQETIIGPPRAQDSWSPFSMAIRYEDGTPSSSPPVEEDGSEWSESFW